MDSYSPTEVEKKWQKIWQERDTYTTNLNDSKKKYYCLVMFPYPSGDKLHIGHWYNFAPVDSYARFMRMQGFNVFEPMGYDAFGLPAENYAIKTGVPPKESTEKNINYMRMQLERIGTMYDWEKEVLTNDPEYYKWTQWIFLELYRKGLVYRKEAPVNWCSSCQTVLANEQVVNGACERCDTEVAQKNLTQWFFKIRDYAEELLDHGALDWPEKTVVMQRNWIGRSAGALVSWKVNGHDFVFDTYTTTLDTIYGVTFIVISPEHPDVLKIVSAEQKSEVMSYIEQAKKKTDIERTSIEREKTGVFTGAYVLHPFTNGKIPLWVADYALMSYGTGVVMGVPAHDQRDQDFAEKYHLPIIQSIESEDGKSFVYDDIEDKYTVRGKIIDSGPFTGMSIQEGRKKMVEMLAKKKLGSFKIEYKLRDWLISRQRYWGAPIPIIRCGKCGDVAVSEKDLPVLLPEKDVDYLPKGKAPLASVASFVNVKCPKCGEKAEREADTMDTFVDSSWYYLRYLTPHKKDGAFDKTLTKKWMPVDMYVGGPEHACMHLLYARFIYKAIMEDRKAEPFKRLVHQGLITKDGAKMSKHKGNVVSPDQFVERYGSDIFRIYMMFMGPFTEGGDWSDRGITGMARFLDRVWRLVLNESLKEDSKEVKRFLHRTIKSVTEDIQIFHFNTALASLMELTNLAYKHGGMSLESKQIMVQLLAPLSPHISEELWFRLGQKFSIFDSSWPSYDEKYLQQAEIQLVVQIDGKVRATIVCPADITEEQAITLAKKDPRIAKYTDGKKIGKEIFVPGKLLNFVVED